MKYLVLSFFLLNTLFAICQQNDFVWLNDSIQYDIRKCYDSNPQHTSYFRIVVNCSKRKQKQFARLTQEEIIALLEDDKHSFATNLMLYSKYGRDAEWYFYNDLTPAQWIEKKQATETEYWKTLLRSERVKKFDP